MDLIMNDLILGECGGNFREYKKKITRIGDNIDEIVENIKMCEFRV